MVSCCFWHVLQNPGWGILLHVSSSGSLCCCLIKTCWCNGSSFFTGCPWEVYSLSFTLTFLSLVSWLEALGTLRKKNLLNRKQGLPRMTPGLPATYSSCNCSSGKRQLQGDEGLAVQKRIGPGHKDSVRLINLALGHPG